MADLESKTPEVINVRFTDGSRITVDGHDAAYLWLHIKNSSDLIPLLYRGRGYYTEGNMTIPIRTLLEETEYEPVTK